MVFTERQKQELIKIIHETSEKVLSDFIKNKTFMENIAKTVADTVSQKIEDCIKNYDSRFERLETKVRDVQGANEELQLKIDDLEQKTKLTRLRIYGLSEENNDRDLKGNVMKLLQQKLAVTDVAVSHCYRMKKRNTGASSVPRAVVVEFGSLRQRNTVFFSKKKLKGTKVVIAEELTSRRFNLLSLARERLGRGKVWTVEGRLYANIDGSRKRLNCEDDIVNLAS